MPCHRLLHPQQDQHQKYFLPLLENLFNTLADGKVFSNINLTVGYNWAQIIPGDEANTTFRTYYGLFEYRGTVRNDNLDAPKSQNTELESNPGQNPLQTARLIGWERNNPLIIDEVAASPPGPKPLAALQDSASKPPVQDARNFPEVPTPDTGSLPSEIDKFLPESYSKLPQSPGEGTEPKEAPNT
ncbi:hypothetical protein DSO57_1011097 [Entomophthora muscae]|uniref:Uncharacterized protein n=1 Tax=Entomophthora muscae TaxID=34485 RepID=A0ACC2T6H6_9FUNG|nr:hypothetical protein DSO57_1011097 [Entomophthora muscae]